MRRPGVGFHKPGFPPSESAGIHNDHRLARKRAVSHPTPGGRSAISRNFTTIMCVQTAVASFANCTCARLLGRHSGRHLQRRRRRQKMRRQGPHRHRPQGRRRTPSGDLCDRGLLRPRVRGRRACQQARPPILLIPARSSGRYRFSLAASDFDDGCPVPSTVRGLC